MKNIPTRLSSLRYPLLLAIAFVLVWTCWPDRSPATAQAAPTRIGVVDTEKILTTSNAGKAAVAQLKVLQDAKEKQLSAMQQEIKNLQAAIQSGRGPAGGAAQLDAKISAARKAQDDATRELTAAKDKMLGDIDTKVMPVINVVGKEMRFALVFRKFESGLIYTDDSTDITDDVIARLNATR